MTRPASPYLIPNFYADAIARGKHRDIVGGRWEETAEYQIAVLTEEGLAPHHHLADIGCGCLRLGHMVLPYLESGHYWGTDASLALMRRGWEVELSPDLQARLPINQLIEDDKFEYAGLPDHITHVISWGVFTHLPGHYLRPALENLHRAFPHLEKALITVFLAPEGHEGPFRQRDGVVTHPDRTPWHRRKSDVDADIAAAGWQARWRESDRLPRGQELVVLTRA